MYLTNIQDLLDASEKMSEEMLKEARELIGFLTLIIYTTTNILTQTLTTTDVSCFRRYAMV
jgi:hypothetical protein